MTDTTVRQQLAAILAADVVAFSSMMERDEQRTLVRVKDARTQVIEPLVAGHGGRVFKTTGDGFLCIFPSAAAAVEAAVDIQMSIGDAEAAEGEPPLCLRIGVSLGDVLIDDGDVFGDGVNLAARLEALAEPGGICISGTAHDTLRGDLGDAFEDDGSHQVKNIARPISVWRWRTPQATDAAGPTGRPASAGAAPTIAILPFDTGSAGPDATALAEDIANDLTSAFAKRTGVAVLAGSLRAALRAAASDLAALRRLGADYVLTGVLRQSGTRVRVSAELLETRDGLQIWSDRYDRTLEDPFELQDELVGLIGTAVRTAMNANEGRMIGDAPPEELTDEQCRAKAAQHFYRFTRDDFQIAGRYLDAVIERSPRDAIALAMKAFTLGFGSMTRLHPLPKRVADSALAMAEQAVQLNRSSDYVFVIRGLLSLTLRNDPAAAEADARQALAISPHYAIARALLGEALVYQGKIEEGVGILRRIIEENRQDPANFARYWMIAMALFAAEDYEAALAEIEQALRLSHEIPSFYLARAAILQMLGRTAEAQGVIDGLEARHRNVTTSTIHQPRYADPAIRERYLGALRAAGLKD